MGDTISISASENPTTGYQWFLTDESTEEPIYRMMENKFLNNYYGIDVD